VAASDVVVGGVVVVTIDVEEPSESDEEDSDIEGEFSGAVVATIDVEEPSESDEEDGDIDGELGGAVVATIDVEEPSESDEEGGDIEGELGGAVVATVDVEEPSESDEEDGDIEELGGVVGEGLLDTETSVDEALSMDALVADCSGIEIVVGELEGSVGEGLEDTAVEDIDSVLSTDELVVELDWSEGVAETEVFSCVDCSELLILDDKVEAEEVVVSIPALETERLLVILVLAVVGCSESLADKEAEDEE
jgi:hypothetical protein